MSGGSLPAGRAGAAVTLGFFVTGIASVLLGPIIPELRAGWGVPPAQAASLFVAQFTTSSIGAVLASFDLRRSLIGGYGLIAVGLAGLGAGGWPLALPAMALMGLGLGLVITASNLWTAHRSPTRRGARLATLNLAWSLGAVSCPLLFLAVGGHLRLGVALGLLALAAVVNGAALWLLLPVEGRERASPPPSEGRGATDAKLGFLVVMAMMFFLYVGVENAVGGWLVALSDELGGERSVVSLLIGSGFWGAILAGRACAPLLLRYTSEPSLYWSCLALAAGGALLLILSESRPAVAGGALAAGLGLAPLFPLTISILAGATAGSRSRKAGWVLACGGLGGAALPWLSGQVTGLSGALRHGFAVPLAGLALLALLHGAQRGLHARSPAADPGTLERLG